MMNALPILSSNTSYLSRDIFGHITPLHLVIAQGRLRNSDIWTGGVLYGLRGFANGPGLKSKSGSRLSSFHSSHF